MEGEKQHCKDAEMDDGSKKRSSPSLDSGKADDNNSLEKKISKCRNNCLEAGKITF